MSPYHHPKVDRPESSDLSREGRFETSGKHATPSSVGRLADESSYLPASRLPENKRLIIIFSRRRKSSSVKRGCLYYYYYYYYKLLLLHVVVIITIIIIIIIIITYRISNELSFITKFIT